MSNRIEWAHASHVVAELVPRGTEFVGYDIPVIADWALYLDLGSAGVVIQGDAFELGRLLGDLAGVLDAGLPNEPYPGP